MTYTINTQNFQQESQHLLSSGFINITHLFSENTLEMLKQQTLSAFHSKAKRKDFVSTYGGGTPRHMLTVSKQNIDDNCGSSISDFYNSPEILQLLSQITGEFVLTSPYVPEMYVINGLSDSNDTHGWHWDDYKYALVFIAQVAPEGCGADVETIAYTNGLGKTIEQVLDKFKPITTHFQEKSIYLLRGEETLHRVSPIREGYTRISMAFTYTDEKDLAIPKNNQSIVDLYN